MLPGDDLDHGVIKLSRLLTLTICKITKKARNTGFIISDLGPGLLSKTQVKIHVS